MSEIETTDGLLNLLQNVTYISIHIDFSRYTRRTCIYMYMYMHVYQHVSVFISHTYYVLCVHVDLYSINSQLGGHHEVCLRYGLPFAQMLFVAGAKHAPAL